MRPDSFCGAVSLCVFFVWNIMIVRSSLILRSAYSLVKSLSYRLWKPLLHFIIAKTEENTMHVFSFSSCPDWQVSEGRRVRAASRCSLALSGSFTSFAPESPRNNICSVWMCNLPRQIVFPNAGRKSFSQNHTKNHIKKPHQKPYQKTTSKPMPKPRQNPVKIHVIMCPYSVVGKHFGHLYQLRHKCIPWRVDFNIWLHSYWIVLAAP